MGFIAGVWRLLGAAEEEHADDGIVEYPGPVARTPSSVNHKGNDPAQRIIDMPSLASNAMAIFKPQMETGGEPGFSMKGYAHRLLSRQAIIVDVNDLAGVDVDEATRIVDYLSGVAEAVSGSVHEIAKNIFIFAPSNIALEGDPLKQVEVY